MNPTLRAFLLTFVCLALATEGLAQSLDAKCAVLSRKRVEELRERFQKDYTVIQVTSFYSPTLDSCIHTEVSEVGVAYEIRDLTHSLMRDGGMFDMLLHCDSNGADSVIVERVRSYRGIVFSVPHREWLDDGFNGPPRTLKTPASPYTKADCEKVFQKWMSLLKP